MAASTRLLPVLLIFMLTSCSFGSSIQRNALDFNSRVASTSNQQIVLNILRASRNESLHFTAVNQLRGSYTGSITMGADADFIGGGAGNTLVVKPSATIGSNPSFDLAVLNNQEFYQGILKPVSAELFDYLARTGIRDEIILYLLVEEVRYKRESFRNRAGTDDFCTFQKFVDDNFKEEGMLRQFLKRQPTTVEIPFDATAERSLEGLAAMVQSGFQVKQDDDEDKIVITKSTPKVVLQIANVDPKPLEFYDQTRGVDGSITLRSPIGIFEYLGEVLNRVQQTESEIASGAQEMCRLTVDEENIRRRISKKANIDLIMRAIMLKKRGVPVVTIFDETEYRASPASQEVPIRELLPLFNLTMAGDLFPDYAVGYRGDTWGVAMDSRVSGRTRQVIWLLTQLIGLQRTAKEPPGTVAVDIVNAPIP